MPENKCESCGKLAKQFCASCKAVFYCSRDCQKKAWKTHKLECHPYIIQTHPIYGRCTVASRDIKAGEIILKEAPLILGPKQSTSPLCLGCHSKTLGSRYFCKQCNYPLCSTVCQNSKLHKAECSVLSHAKSPISFTNLSSPHPAYECITPLRCLLLQKEDPQKWNTMMKLQSHHEDIVGSEMHNVNKRNVVEFIRVFLGYADEDEETIHRICGILQTNCFELLHNGQKIRGLYFSASMFAHNCTPNTKHVYDEDHNIIFRVTTNIKKGQQLYTTYTQTLWDTISRRHQLKIAKFFLCACDRCQDPQELGTNISTLFCSKCKGEIYSSDPLNSNSDWICSRCNCTSLAKQIRFGNDMLNKELRSLSEGVPASLEKFIERYKAVLHTNHRFMLEAKYALIKFYGNSTNYPYKNLTQNQLENKVLWSRELLKVINIIDPEKSYLRGIILFELQAGIVGMAKYLLSNDLITKEKAGEYMTEAVGYLQEASEILKHDPQYDNGGLEKKLEWLSQELEI